MSWFQDNTKINLVWLINLWQPVSKLEIANNSSPSKGSFSDCKGEINITVALPFKTVSSCSSGWKNKDVDAFLWRWWNQNLTVIFSMNWWHWAQRGVLISLSISIVGSSQSVRSSCEYLEKNSLTGMLLSSPNGKFCSPFITDTCKSSVKDWIR